MLHYDRLQTDTLVSVYRIKQHGPLINEQSYASDSMVKSTRRLVYEDVQRQPERCPYESGPWHGSLDVPLRSTKFLGKMRTWMSKDY